MQFDHCLMFSVMQRELDKMERFARKIVDQAKLPSTVGEKLLKEVKVGNDLKL